MQVGDLVIIDGGMVSMEVIQKAGPDVRCSVVDPGIILSRANLTVRRHGKILRGRNASLPILTSKASQIAMLFEIARSKKIVLLIFVSRDS